MMESRLLIGYTFFVQFHKYYGNVIVNVIVYGITVLVMFTYSV